MLSSIYKFITQSWGVKWFGPRSLTSRWRWICVWYLQREGRVGLEVVKSLSREESIRKIGWENPWPNWIILCLCKVSLCLSWECLHLSSFVLKLPTVWTLSSVHFARTKCFIYGWYPSPGTYHLLLLRTRYLFIHWNIFFQFYNDINILDD